MLAMVLGLLVSNICYAQSAKDGVRALQRLQARVEAGISLKDYTPALGDTLFEVKLFLNSPEAKTKPELATSLNKAMEFYMAVRDIWNYKVRNTGRHGPPQRMIISEKMGTIKIAEDLFKVCPRLKNEIHKMPTHGYDWEGDGSGLMIEPTMKILWEEAGKELEKAITLLSNG